MGTRKFLDLTGKKFNSWLVISLDEIRTKPKNIYWLCICDCGKKRSVNGSKLKENKTESCGCFRVNLFWEKTSRDESAYRDLWRRHQASRKTKDKTYLKYHEWKNLVLKNCTYCGDPPESKLVKRYKITIPCHGIDRVDSTIGYTLKNSVPCCRHCNTAKLEMSIEEFFNHLIKIIKHSKIEIP